MSELPAVLAVVALGEFVLLVMAFRAIVKIETEAIRHFSYSLKASGERAAAQARVRQLEADRDLGKGGAEQ